MMCINSATYKEARTWLCGLVSTFVTNHNKQYFWNQQIFLHVHNSDTNSEESNGTEFLASKNTH